MLFVRFVPVVAIAKILTILMLLVTVMLSLYIVVAFNCYVLAVMLLVLFDGHG